MIATSATPPNTRTLAVSPVAMPSYDVAGAGDGAATPLYDPADEETTALEMTGDEALSKDKVLIRELEEGPTQWGVFCVQGLLGLGVLLPWNCFLLA